jgi:hypothetical protein
VLLINVLNFRFVYPTERDLIPRWLYDELLERLKAQDEMPPASVKICRGRLISPTDYVIDVSEWGFGDVVGKESTRSMSDQRTEPTQGKLTVAAIGDLHVRENNERRYRELFAEISEVADVLALAGDLTDFGKTGEAELLAEDLRACTIPMVGVLGNHDFESGQPEEVAEIMRQAGVVMLDDQATMIDGVGFAGVKASSAGSVAASSVPSARCDQGLRRRVAQRGAQARKPAAHIAEATGSWPSSIIRRSPRRWRANRWKSSLPGLLAPCRCGRPVRQRQGSRPRPCPSRLFPGRYAQGHSRLQCRAIRGPGGGGPPLHVG